MQHQYTPFAIHLMIAAFIMVALAVYAWKRRSAPGAAIFALLMLAATEWTLGYALELGGVDRSTKLFWSNVNIIGVVLVPIAWFVFAVQYGGYERMLTRRNMLVLSVMPLVTLGLAWTNGYHHLYWKEVSLRIESGYSALDFTYSAWFFIFAAYSYLLILSGTILIARQFIRSPRAYIGQKLSLLIGAAAPWLANIIHISGLSPFPGLDLTPFAFAVTGVAFALSLYGFQLFNIVPLARDMVIDGISDGVIVLDASNHVVVLNLAAQGIIGHDLSQAKGRYIERLWSAWPSGIRLLPDRIEFVRDITTEVEGERRFFDFRIHSLFDQRNRLSGRLVVLRDITQHKQAEEALRRRDDILEAINFAAEQFLGKGGWEHNIQDVLARLGEAAGVSRVYIFENYRDQSSRLLTSQRYEWVAPGVDPQIDNPDLQDFPYNETGFERWAEVLSQGEVIFGHVKDFPAGEREGLGEQGILSVVIAPIFIDENWWGFIGLDECFAERAWSFAEIDSLKAAANTVGAAIQHERSEEQLQRRSQVISTLLDVSETIGSTLDVQQVLDRIVIAARRLLSVDRVAVFMWDEDAAILVPTIPSSEGQVELMLSEELRGEYSELHLDPEELALVKALRETKEAVSVDDASQSEFIPREQAQRFGIRSLLAAPFVIHDRFLGVLYLDYTNKVHTFTPEEIELSSALARQAALALDRARLYTQSKRDAEELAALYRASTRLLSPGGDLRTLAEQITQVVVGEFEFAYCSLLMVDLEENELKVIAQSGFWDAKEVPLPLDGAGLTVAAVQSGEVVYAPDVSQERRYIEVASTTRSEIVFPLIAGGEVIGVLNLESPRLEAFDERSQRILTAFVEDVALSLQNVRLFNAAETNARQMALINDITRTALEIPQTEEMLEALTDRLRELLGADDCYISLWDEERRIVLPGAASENVRTLYISIQPEPDEITITENVLNSNQHLIIEDVFETPWVSPRIAAHFPTRSLLALPLVAGELKLGAVIIGFHRPHHFSRRQISLGQQASRQVALALAKARSLDYVQRYARQTALLNDITRAALGGADHEVMLQILADRLGELFEADGCFITLWDEAKQMTTPAAAYGKNRKDYLAIQIEPGERTLTASVLEVGHVLVAEDAFDNPFIEPGVVEKFSRDKFSTRSLLVLPLIAGGQKLGAALIGFDHPHQFTHDEIALGERAAGQVALAIAKAQSLELAQRRAQEAEKLRQAGAIVAATLDQDQAIQHILEQLARVVPYDSASVQLLGENYMEIVGGIGWSDESSVIGLRFPVPGDNPNTVVVEQRCPYIINDAPSVFPEFRREPHSHIRSWLGVPLIVHDRLIGMLAMDSKRPDYFTKDHARLATAFADQVAIVIENARLYTAEQQRVQQLDALRATAADISAELDLSRLLQAILERAVTLLGATGGELGLVVEGEKGISIVACHNMGKDYSGTHLAMGEGAMGYVANTLHPVIIENYEEWENRSSQYVEGPWHGVMATPLILLGNLVGAIGVVDANPERSFSESDIQLLNMFAQQSVIAYENARLYQAAREAAERRAILHRVSQEVVAAISEPEKIYATIHKAAAQLMPAEAFAITQLDEKQEELEAVYLVDRGKRVPSVRVKKDQGLSERILETGESVYIEDLDASSNFQGIHFGMPEPTRSVLAVPMRLGDKVIGMVSTQSYKPNAYTPEDQYLLEMLAAHAAIALDNTRLFSEVQWLAITDPLTGVYNRRGLFELGKHEVDRARRFNRPLAAIMLDIDHFKHVNDAYGHATGDQVLAALIRSCREQIREVDIMGRYGGEEFIILLPETNMSSGCLVAERLRRHVAGLSIQTDRATIKVTVSMGVANYTEDVQNLEVLMDRADAAMYAAKQAGRNQVIGQDEGEDL